MPATESHDHPLGIDAPARYIDSQGRVIYRASGFGRCPRALVAAARGEQAMPYPEWFQAVLQEGKDTEQAIIERFESEYAGVVVADQQKMVELEVMDNVFIRGSIDGLFYRELDSCLFEAKKVRKSGWEKFLQQKVEMLPAYPWQTSFYMHALGVQDMAFVGGLVDEDGQLWEIHTHWYTAPPLSMKAIVKRIREVERMIGIGLGAKEVKCTGDYPCPYYMLHDEPVDPETGEPVVDGDAFIVPREHQAAWQDVVAKMSATDEQLKVLKKKVGDLASLKEQHATQMRELAQVMGAEKAKEIHGRLGAKLVVKRVSYDRKAYEVKAAHVDYWKIEDKNKPKSGGSEGSSDVAE